MTIPRNDQLKAGIVSRLKGNSVVTALLVSVNGISHPEEIREAQWQGDEFYYPNVRVRVVENKPNKQNCNYSNVKIGIAVFSEDASSQEADNIAGIIGNELHTQSFSSENIKYNNLTIDDLFPAIRIDEQTWMSEVILSGTANG